MTLESSVDGCKGAKQDGDDFSGHREQNGQRIRDMSEHVREAGYETGKQVCLRMLLKFRISTPKQ